MKASEIRELSDTELEHKLDEVRTELFNLRFQLATGQLDNPMQLKQVRRSIAKIQTIRQERELNIRVVTEEKPKTSKAKKPKEEKEKSKKVGKEKTQKAKADTKKKKTEDNKEKKAQDSKKKQATS